MALTFSRPFSPAGDEWAKGDMNAKHARFCNLVDRNLVLDGLFSLCGKMWKRLEKNMRGANERS